jgi:acyl-CoA thioesterase I
MKPMSPFKQVVCLLLIAVLSASAQVTVIRVACVGNSITIGSNATQPYPLQLGQLLGPHYNVGNFGVSGRTLLKKGDFPYWNETAFADVQLFRPHIIIMCLGTNDSKPQNWAYKSEFYADYMDMIRVFRSVVPNAHIIVCNPPPAYSAAWDISDAIIHNEIMPILRRVRSAARTDSIDFYGGMTGQSALFPDGIHPNNAGYALMANIALGKITNSPSGIIRYFNAKPASYEKNETVVFYWETTQNSKAVLNGAAVKDADSLAINPPGPSRYTLRTQGTFSDSASVMLTYLPPGRIKSFTADPPVLDEGSDASCTLKWATTSGSTVKLDGIGVDATGSKTVSPKKTTTYTLAASGDENHTSSLTVAVLPPDQVNRAASRPVVAAASTGGSQPQWAVDGDTATAWLSGKTGSQSFYADLGAVFDIKRVVLIWGKTYGILYHMYTLDALDGDTRKLKSEYAGNGGTDDQSGLSQSGRWVKLTIISRNNIDSALVLKEIEVYGTKPGTGMGGKTEAPSGPRRFELAQNYPNPFNPSTRFEYSLAAPGRVKITIIDVMGRAVRILADEMQDAGSHAVLWDAKTEDGGGAETGVYFVRIETNRGTLVRKLSLLK